MNYRPERIAFEATIDHFMVLPPIIKDELWNGVRILEYSKNDFILKQGQVEQSITFLYKGMIRAYQMQETDDVSLDFRFGGEMITAYTSYISEQPSPIAIQALQDCVVLKFDKKEVIEKLYDKYHQFERMGRLVSEYFYLRRITREIELLSNTAEERYRMLIEREPDLVAQIPVKYLASYLGIRKQSLSRIRSNIFGKKNKK